MILFRWTYNEDLKGWRFYEPDGSYATGWKIFNMSDGEKTVHTCFFDKETGKMVVGWKHFELREDHEKPPHWVYLGKNGWLRKGWVYLTEEDGVKAGWRYFNGKGWLQFGFYDDGQLHYLDEQGCITIGWATINGFKYYFNELGWANRNGFFTIDGHRYYFDKNARLKFKLKVPLSKTMRRAHD